MAAPVSAGVLVWRASEQGPQFLLVHPGGPYWRGKDTAAWSIPKGLVEPGEDNVTAARREFEEELGLPAPQGGVELTPCRLPGGKWVHAWLAEADLDLGGLKSNLFEMEWPPRSGRRQAFPEVDRADYFSAEEALVKIHRGQQPIVQDALKRLRPR